MLPNWLKVISIIAFIIFCTDLSAQERPQLTPDSLFSLARKAAFSEKNYIKAISLSKEALAQIPDYNEVQIFLARVYFWNHQIDKALAEAQKLQLVYPQNEEVLQLLKNIQSQNVRNRIWISYDFVHFDKGYNAALHNSPWHLISTQYMRFTARGPLIARINYANRFQKNGLQAELEAYPRLSKHLYSYVELGVSPDFPVYPKFRAGGSLYGILPKQFEVELGSRYLQFDAQNWIYVVGVSKYEGNYYFNLRSFLTKNGTNSYNFTGRYYLGSADAYVSMTLGTGVSPDESQRNVLLNTETKLKAYRLIAEYRRVVKEKNIVGVLISGQRDELSPKAFGHQLNFGLLYQRMF